MNHLFALKATTLNLLVVVLLGITILQLLHSLFLTAKTTQKSSRLVILYEFLLVLYLFIACSAAMSALQGHGHVFLRFKPYAILLEPFLWLNFAIAIMGMYAYRKKGFLAHTPEFIALVLSMPPVIAKAGGFTGYLLIVSSSYFLFRTLSNLMIDLKLRASEPTFLSLVESLDKLPEGIAWTTTDYQMLYMNDAMRSCLMKLGFGTDLSDTSDLWRKLEWTALNHREQKDAVLAEGIRIHFDKNETRLFMRDSTVIRGTTCRRIYAIDVTEEERLNEKIEQVNEELAVKNKELNASLAQLQKVAQNKALVDMQARVHDTIGQRLSILHRYLESNDSDPEKLKQVVDLLHDITADLDSHAQPNAQAELDSIKNAFSLIGIDIVVSGVLPEDPAVAAGYTRIIREASTNAVKHGHAKRVSVDISEAPEGRTLIISNDGVAASEGIRFGTGLPGMNETAKSFGGTLAVTSYSPFTIVVKQKFQ